MMDSLTDFVSMLNEWVNLPGFTNGVVFIFMWEIFFQLVNLPFYLINLYRQRRISFDCKLRYDGLLVDPCHCKDCPSHDFCAFYIPCQRWSFLKSLFHCKKDGAT